MCEPRWILLTENQVKMIDKAIVTHLCEGDGAISSEYEDLRDYLKQSYYFKLESEYGKND